MHPNAVARVVFPNPGRRTSSRRFAALRQPPPLPRAPPSSNCEPRCLPCLSRARYGALACAPMHRPLSRLTAAPAVLSAPCPCTYTPRSRPTCAYASQPSPGRARPRRYNSCTRARPRPRCPMSPLGPSLSLHASSSNPAGTTGCAASPPLQWCHPLELSSPAMAGRPTLSPRLNTCV